MKRLVLHDEHCRRMLITHGFLGAAAIGLTGFVLSTTGFRGGAVLTTLPALAIVLLASCFASWVELRARGRLLRHLLATGVRMPVTQTDIVWSDDPESSYGIGVWPYWYRGNRYEIHTLESTFVKVPPDATALIDPDRPERALLITSNGITRGGDGLSEGSLSLRIVLVSLLVASWGLWTVAVVLSLAWVGR